LNPISRKDAGCGPSAEVSATSSPRCEVGGERLVPRGLVWLGQAIRPIDPMVESGLGLKVVTLAVGGAGC
jgi:hypothetical protein